MNTGNVTELCKMHKNINCTNINNSVLILYNVFTAGTVPWKAVLQCSVWAVPTYLPFKATQPLCRI